MARLIHFGPTGDADNAVRYSAGESNTGLPDDYSLHWRLMANDGALFGYNVSGGQGAIAAVNKNPAYRRFWFRVWTLPSVETVFWYNIGTSSGGVALIQLTIDTVGDIRLYNKGNGAFPGELLGGGIVGAVTLAQWHRMRVVCNVETVPLKDCSTLGCGSVSAQIDSQPLLTGTSFIGTNVLPHQGIGIPQLQTRDVLGRLESANATLDIDYSNLVVDDAALPVDSRISAVKVVGVGTYQEWVAAGNADWRARNTWPNQSTTATGIRTDTAGQRQTYLMESFAAAGISGTILGAQIHICLAQAPGTAPSLIVRQNGGETTTLAWAMGNGQYLRYRLDVSTWTLSDTFEFGLLSSVGTSRISAMVLTVEHTTPVPPITITDIETVEVSWTGNATAQTVALPFAPQWIWWWPRTASASGGFWSAEANVSQYASIPGTGYPDFIVRGANLYLVGATASGANSSAVAYDALVIKDPKMRMVGAAAYAQPNVPARDDYTVTMLDPDGAVFAPLTVIAIPEQAGTTTVFRYRGPGHTGDTASSLLQAVGTAADFIQSLTATGFQAGKSLNADAQQTSFVGFRRANFNQLFLMDTFPYVGNGAAGTRVVPCSLSGLIVKWAMVIPLAAAQRAMRNAQQSTGKQLQAGGGTYLNSIEALGVDSITVGTSLNGSGITFSVLVFGYGTDPAPPPISTVEMIRCLHGAHFDAYQLAGGHRLAFDALGSYRATLELEAGYRGTLAGHLGSLKSAITGLTGSI